MIEVVLDTNVFISAIIFGGKPREVLHLIINQKIRGFISPYIVFELKEVLYKKFDFDILELEKMEQMIDESFVLVYPKKEINLIKKCPADNRILECAVESKADFLITGDTKHILRLKKIGKIIILDSKKFLKFYEKWCARRDSPP